MKQREEKKMKAHAQCQLDEHLATAEREGPCSPFWPNPATTHGVSGCRAPGARLARALGGGVTVLRKSGRPGPSALGAARVSPAARGTNSLSRAVLGARRTAAAPGFAPSPTTGRDVTQAQRLDSAIIFANVI